ncbi:hypothetical protein MKW98_025996 [Papaver atlanticum]|uniref:Cellulose synthase-like protein G3 n=1 Tax=Papaver atlanticum TaxID=357466 RepID=A0AAD4X4H6_9MAGN|nr:hypothetical protein MKW98_025996 [Papaver atlanticum]
MKNGEKTSAFPLNSYEVHPRTIPSRVFMLIYVCGIIALLYHHLTSLRIHSVDLLPSILLLIADLVLSFMWVACQAFRWCPVRRKVYPENLSKVVDEDDLPTLDVFICTADPYKEPPMEVVNTALSVLAFDYPSNKISVYVSDDGGSQMTLFALIQGAKFAREWLPFCKKHNLSKRCPKVVFNQHDSDADQLRSCIPEVEFLNMKILYEEMRTKVEHVMVQGCVDDDMLVNEEEHQVFSKWKVNGFTCQDHPTIIQMLMESLKDVDVSGTSLPNFIYLSRQKNKHIHHNYKAGALNALIRASAIMTSAPIVLCIDCDMYCNNPQAPRLALCHLLDPIEGSKIAFVQFPPRFRGINPSDIYNSEFTRPYIINPEGLDGIGAVNFVGSGPFVNRKAFYGAPTQSKVNIFPGFNGDHEGALDRITMSSSKLILEAASRVADCNYEQETNWGLTLGFRYGSMVEDFLTGFRMQCEGWRSLFCNPTTPAFLGDFPISLNDSLVQVQRWSLGLTEVGFSKYSPFTFGTKNHSLLMGMAYGFYSIWPLWAIPMIIYGVLPQLCLIHNIYLFPKVSDPWFYLYAYLFSATYIQDFIESYYVYGINLKSWWNEQRMWLMRAASSCVFSFIELILYQIGIAPDFRLTSKVIDDEQQKRYNREIFEFGVDSPIFVSLSTFALVNLVSFSFGIMKIIFIDGKLEEMSVQLFLSGFVLVNSWPIYEAMVWRKDGGRMPAKVTLISALITLVLCYASGFATK